MKIKMSKESVHKGQKHSNNNNNKSRGHSKADLSWFQMQIIKNLNGKGAHSFLHGYLIALYALIAKSDWPSSSIASFVHGH